MLKKNIIHLFLSNRLFILPYIIFNGVICSINLVFSVRTSLGFHVRLRFAQIKLKIKKQRSLLHCLHLFQNPSKLKRQAKSPRDE